MPVILLVVYLSKGKYRQFPAEYREERGGLVMIFSFPIIKLWEQAERIRSGDLKELAPLLILCEDHPTAATLEEERRIIQSLDVDEASKNRLMGLAVALGGRFFAEEVIESVFKEGMQMATGISFIDRWMDEREAKGRDEGRDEGLVAGRDEGRDEGLVKGRAEVLQRLLERRFGPLDEGVRHRLAEANADSLLAWADRVLDAATADEVVRERSQ